MPKEHYIAQAGACNVQADRHPSHRSVASVSSVDSISVDSITRSLASSQLSNGSLQSSWPCPHTSYPSDESLVIGLRKTQHGSGPSSPEKPLPPLPLARSASQIDHQRQNQCPYSSSNESLPLPLITQAQQRPTSSYDGMQQMSRRPLPSPSGQRERPHFGLPVPPMMDAHMRSRSAPSVSESLAPSYVRPPSRITSEQNRCQTVARVPPRPSSDLSERSSRIGPVQARAQALLAQQPSPGPPVADLRLSNSISTARMSQSRPQVNDGRPAHPEVAALVASIAASGSSTPTSSFNLSEIGQTSRPTPLRSSHSSHTQSERKVPPHALRFPSPSPSPSGQSIPASKNGFLTDPRAPPAHGQCWGINTNGKRCMRKMVAAVNSRWQPRPCARFDQPSESSRDVDADDDDDDEAMGYCAQHAARINTSQGFYLNRGRIDCKYVAFCDYIPSTLSASVTARLRTIMEKAPSSSDSASRGYLYCYEIRSLRSAGHGGMPDRVALKVGRAANVQHRMAQWTRQCPSKTPSVGFFLPSDASTQQRLLPGVAAPSRPGIAYAAQWERLVHLELAERCMRWDGTCADCGAKHREIFICDETYGMRGVREVVERWQRFVEL